MREDKIPVRIYFTLTLLGFWLFASTLSFGIRSLPILYGNAICSALLVFFGLKCRRKTTALEIWSIVAIGIWLQLSPLFFWAPAAASYLNDTFVGSLVIALAITLHPMPGHTFDEEATIPPGWSYNPSAWAQRFPVAAIAFLCWMISRYLAAYQLGYISTVWEPFFEPGTEAVLTSNVSKLFPVSDAGLGAFAYTMEFFATVQGGADRWKRAPWLVLIFGILVIPVSLVSTILIILQPLAVGTWCTLCLLTALSMLTAIPFAIGEVAAAVQFLRHTKGKAFWSLLFKGAECPGERPDTRSLPMDAPLWALIKESLAGMTLPWNLCLSALIGIFLMAIPTLFGLAGALYNTDPILGAFTTLIAVISFSEVVRSVRWLQIVLALILLIITWGWTQEQALGQLLLHTALALAIALLAIRKGPIREESTLRL